MFDTFVEGDVEGMVREEGCLYGSLTDTQFPDGLYREVHSSISLPTLPPCIFSCLFRKFVGYTLTLQE